MERHDSAKIARKDIEQGMRLAKKPEDYFAAAQANALLAVAEEIHRHSEILVEIHKLDYNKFIKRQ